MSNWLFLVTRGNDAVVHITPQSTMNIIQSFVCERFQWTNKRTRGEQHKFKSDLYSYYEAAHSTNEALAYDCSTGIFIEKKLVIAGHLWKAEWKPH